MSKRLFTILLAWLAISIHAIGDKGGFIYEDIRYEALVSKDNVWKVKIVQTVKFYEPRHGIYLYVPYTFNIGQEVRQADGTVKVEDYRYRAYIEDVTVDGDPYDIKDEDDCEVLIIGDKDKTVVGEHKYHIVYTYVYPDDRITTRDLVFHSILGTGFSSPIKHLSFSITFEKEVPEEAKKAMKVFLGKYGERKEAEGITWNGNSLAGSIDSINSNEALTLYMPLEEGYFENAKAVSSEPMYIFVLLTLIFAVIIILKAWLTKHPTVTKQIEFYPPNDICSAEVGAITDNSVDAVDIASIIPWFAGKGYISISEGKKDSKYTDKKEYLILKKKDPLPADAPEYQKLFMDALFNGKETVRLDEVKPSPEKMLKTHSSLQGIFKGEKKLLHMNISILIYIPLLIFSTLAFANTSEVQYFDNMPVAYALLLWAFPFFCGMIFNSAIAERQLFIKRSFKIAYNITKAVVAIALFFLYIFTKDEDMMSSGVAMMLFVVCFLCTERIRRFFVNSRYRADMSGKLLGLKEFIETAEKERLKTMLYDDPDYFYRIMPYAMVFGLTDKWAEHFKDIEIRTPEWYENSGHSTLTTLNYLVLMNAICANSQTAVNSMYTTSSGAVSGGGHSFSGGFAGGGGAGGGGGSW